MVKYHPVPLWALKKMMRSNAASLMAGGGAVYLNFDNGSAQNIIKSFITDRGAFTKLVRCKYTEALMRGGWTHYHMGLLSTNFVSLVSALKIHSWCILTWNRGNGDYENNFSVLFPGSINMKSVMLISDLFFCCKKWDTDISEAWNYKHEGNSPMNLISSLTFRCEQWNP